MVQLHCSLKTRREVLVFTINICCKTKVLRYTLGVCSCERLVCYRTRTHYGRRRRDPYPVKCAYAWLWGVQILQVQVLQWGNEIQDMQLHAFLSAASWSSVLSFSAAAGVEDAGGNVCIFDSSVTAASRLLSPVLFPL